jgi:hypothetical protein
MFSVPVLLSTRSVFKLTLAKRFIEYSSCCGWRGRLLFQQSSFTCRQWRTIPIHCRWVLCKGASGMCWQPQLHLCGLARANVPTGITTCTQAQRDFPLFPNKIIFSACKFIQSVSVGWQPSLVPDMINTFSELTVLLCYCKKAVDDFSQQSLKSDGSLR